MRKVTLEIGGELRELKFSARGLAEAEAELGDITEGSWFSNFGIRKAAILLRAALLFRLPNLRVEHVYGWLPTQVSSEEFGRLAEALGKALAVSQGIDPDAVEQDEDESGGPEKNE